MAMADLGSDSPSSDIELAGSASVDLEPANATSSGQRSLLDETRKAKSLKKRRASKKRVTDMHPDATTVLDLKAFYS